MTRVNKAALAASMVFSVGTGGCESDDLAAGSGLQLNADSPAPTEMRPIVRSAADTFDPIVFRANLLSEDGIDPVYAVLLLNYGFESPLVPAQPYESELSAMEIAPGTFDEGPRSFELTWTPEEENESRGCASITLLVTHEYDGNTPRAKCPFEESDQASITWFFPVCETLADCDANACLQEPPGGFTYCF